MNYEYIDKLADCIKNRYCETDSDNYFLYADALIGFLEKDKFKPTILSDTQFNEQNTLSLYRGYNTSDEKLDTHKHNLAFGNFQRRFLSKNVHGIGLYFSDEKSTAQTYASKPNNIITVKLAENAKIVPVERLKNLIENSDKFIRYQVNILFGDRLSSSNKDYFISRIYNNYESMFAAYLFQIDGITSDVKNYGTNYIIFNRSALVINEKEFKDVIDQTVVSCEPGVNE